LTEKGLPPFQICSLVGCSSASLNNPLGIAVDASGNLYIADTSNWRVRKVDANGIITTFAGNGVVGYTSDGVPAVSSALSAPRAVAVDASGNVYIADANTERIRRVGAADGLISTVGGSGAVGLLGDGALAVLGGLNSPQGVAVDAAGNIYVADTNDDRIRKIGP
jgi:trimeric autotransporter adhesin